MLNPRRDKGPPKKNLSFIRTGSLGFNAFITPPAKENWITCVLYLVRYDIFIKELSTQKEYTLRGKEIVLHYTYSIVYEWFIYLKFILVF